MKAQTHYSFELTVAIEQYDTVLALLYNAGMSGCEERTQGNDRIQLTTYFTTETAARNGQNSLPADMAHEVSENIQAVVNQDWNAKWRASMEPAKIATGWWVSPDWLPPPLNPGDHWIKIEPKMAFGTGHHESTRLAAGALIELIPACSSPALLDIGTGSGVLCFAAAQLGASSCTGVEIDGDCRENLAENSELNPTAAPCRFMIGTLDALRNSGGFDIIVMNMIHTESAPLLESCRHLLRSGGSLVWSGILAAEYHAAEQAAAHHAFTLTKSSTEHEWWCGIFTVENK